MPDVCREGGTFVIHLDEAAARHLWTALYVIGEHQAAGAPIPPPTPEEVQSLGDLLTKLDIALGGSGRLA